MATKLQTLNKLTVNILKPELSKYSPFSYLYIYNYLYMYFFVLKM